MVTKDDFVLHWEKAMGFKGDPFTTKILTPINKFLVNRKDEKENINWFFIKNFEYGTILGDKGIGKSNMLRWLENRLAKYNRIHTLYINAEVFSEQINIPQKILLPLLSFYERKFSKPHTKLLTTNFVDLLKKKLGNKSVALLIDNAHHLTDKNIVLIKDLKKDGLKVHTIVTCTQKEYDKSKLKSIGKDELKINLRKFTYDEAKEIIQRRISGFGGKGIHPLKEETLKKIYDKHCKNTKEFLKNCRDEAIKVLIHKREELEKSAVDSKKEKPLKKSKDEPIDKEQNKKKKFSIKFSNKNDEPEDKEKEYVGPMNNDNRKAIFDEDHKADLISQLSAEGSKRGFKVKPKPKKKEKVDDSDTDKLLKELAEEFEVD